MEKNIPDYRVPPMQPSGYRVLAASANNYQPTGSYEPRLTVNTWTQTEDSPNISLIQQEVNNLKRELDLIKKACYEQKVRIGQINSIAKDIDMVYVEEMPATQEDAQEIPVIPQQQVVATPVVPPKQVVAQAVPEVAQPPPLVALLNVPLAQKATLTVPREQMVVPASPLQQQKQPAVLQPRANLSYQSAGYSSNYINYTAEFQDYHMLSYNH